MTKAKIVSWSMIIILLLTMLAGMQVSALAQTVNAGSVSVINSSVRVNPPGDPNTILLNAPRNQRVDIRFDIAFDNLNLGDLNDFVGGVFTIGSESLIRNTGNWELASNSQVRLDTIRFDNDRMSWTARVRISNVARISDHSRLDIQSRDSTQSLRFEHNSNVLVIDPISVTVPVVGQGSGSSGDSNDSSDFRDLPTPRILVESTRALNAAGQVITEITEDTSPFTLEVFFNDFGLIHYNREIEATRLEAFAGNDTGGFFISPTRGRLRQIDSASITGAPRFIASFTNVTFNGGGTTLNFHVHYDIFGELVHTTAVANFAHLISDEEDDEDDEIPIQTPHIIVSHFSYGGESIVAGSEFNLDITTLNTSSEVALENILIRITLPEGISIASASNTIYVERIAAGGTLSHSIPLWARTNASAGSHAIQIEFSFEYIEGRRRESGTGSESISVPVTQIDRFTVDPITDMSDFVNVGDMFFVSVSFVNQGMSPVYNISAQARGINMDIISTVGRMEGVLAASAHGTIDLDIVANQPGELLGEVVITYEDENMNQREVTMPFSLPIQEQFFPEFPGPEFPGGEFPGWHEEDQGLAPLSILLIVIGGLLVAIPITIYIARRIKAKESEEFDDDF